MRFHFSVHWLDTDRRELRRGSTVVAVEPQVFDLLVYLIQNRARVVSKDDLVSSIWAGRIVSDSSLTSRINAARRAIADSGEKQELIRTFQRRGFRFVGDVREEASADADSANPAAAFKLAPRQEIHFCTAPDGVRIAYAQVGAGPPLMKAANYLNHLEYDWQSPVWRPLLHALASKYRLTRYDARGNGLSDWIVEDFSFDVLVQDLEAVTEASRLERFPLLGISQGCALAVGFAVRNPARVRHLVLYGGYARGKRRRGSERDIRESDALGTLIREGWGRDNPAFRQTFTSLFIPDGTPEQVQWWNELERRTTSPENAAHMRRAWDDIDITDLLPRVQCPTLVLHCREDAVQPFDEGRRLAAGIPRSRFVALEGRNHVILQQDPSWSRFLLEVHDFLANAEPAQ
jgi:DNA-binding winged helix-turn-helix (wHTH) protein/pimeloyl-ACP methyl ester carboxylesterase